MMDWTDNANSWGWGNWAGMGLMMLLFWTVIAFAVVAIVRSLRQRNHSPAAHRTARETLDQRFASGAITEDEYAHQRELINTP